MKVVLKPLEFNQVDQSSVSGAYQLGDMICGSIFKNPSDFVNDAKDPNPSPINKSPLLTVMVLVFSGLRDMGLSLVSLEERDAERKVLVQHSEVYSVKAT